MSGIYLRDALPNGKPACCERCIFCNGEYCLFHGTEEYRSWADEYRHCPLVPVPDHGRLIDADELYEMCALSEDTDVMASAKRINEYLQIKIDEAETIIPADKGDV